MSLKALEQKAERVKELIFYNELTLSEMPLRWTIVVWLTFSSQFKKEIGMTPSEFKKIRNPSHKPFGSSLKKGLLLFLSIQKSCKQSSELCNR